MIEKVKQRCDPAGKADYKEGRIVLISKNCPPWVEKERKIYIMDPDAAEFSVTDVLFFLSLYSATVIAFQAT